MNKRSSDNEIKNVRVIAISNRNEDTFDIYIEFSGRKEYLMSHRYYSDIYYTLSKGIRIKELYRIKQKMITSKALPGHRYNKGKVMTYLKEIKNHSRKLENSLNHIIAVAEEYIRYENYNREYDEAS